MTAPANTEKDANGNYYFVTVPDGDSTATKDYSACIDKMEKAAAADGKEPDFDVKKTKSTLKVLTYFEKKYTCSGVCTIPKFYASYPLTKGMPKKACLADLKYELKENFMFLGLTMVIMAIIMFFMWIFQYCLWK